MKKLVINMIFVLSLSCAFGMGIYASLSHHQAAVIVEHVQETTIAKIESTTIAVAQELTVLYKTSYALQIKIGDLTPDYSPEYKQELIDQMMATEDRIRHLEGTTIDILAQN